MTRRFSSTHRFSRCLFLGAAGPSRLLALCLCALCLRVAPTRADSGCGLSGAFTIDNRGGSGITIYQRAVGTFLADVPFQNTFKAVVDGWGGCSPGTVIFSLNGQSVTVSYGAGGAETSAFDMGALPAGNCAVASTLEVTARNAAGTTVGRSSVPLRAIGRPWFMPPNVRAKSVSPLQWGQSIVYEVYPKVSFMNLDATWYGKNVLFENYGGLFSGGKLNIEFDGGKGEYTFEIEGDVSLSPNPVGELWKPVTHARKISMKGERTLTLGLSATATINSATGCFDGGPEVCGDGQFGYEWKLVPVGPLFAIPGLWFTGKASFDIAPQMCFAPLAFSLENPLPLTAVNIDLNLMGQGGLELGIPYFLSVFGGLEGNAGGQIHVLGDPVPTCWDWPYVANLDFDLSVVGYARLADREWVLGPHVIVQWTCPTGRALRLVPVADMVSPMRPARRPYLASGENYAQFWGGEPAMLRSNPPTGEVDELITSNVNLEATPSTAVWGNLTLLVTSEDDPSTPQYAEHEIQAVLRDGGAWGAKQAVTDNADPDILPTAGFDVSGKAITAWTTIAGATGTEDLPAMKAKMEIAYSVYDNGTQTWAEPSQITSNGTLDALPQIARGGDGSTTLVWLRSVDNTLPVGPGEDPGTPPAVLAAHWNGTAFGTPEVLLASCDAIGPVRYARDAAARQYLLWTRDVDGNFDTTEDREAMESHTVGGVWTAPSALTSDAVQHTAVALIPSTGGMIACYVGAGSGGTAEAPADQLLARRFDGTVWSSESILLTSSTILSPSFAVAQNGQVSCAWIGPALNAQGKAVLYASSPNGIDGWTEPQEMACASSPTAPSCVYQGPNLQVSYVSARPAAQAAGLGVSLAQAPSTAFDVRFLEHTPYADLWIQPDDIAVEPRPPVAGQLATISVTVHLSGDYAQTAVQAEVFDGDPAAGGSLIGVASPSLTPGGTATVQFPWTYPSDCGQHSLFARLDGQNVIIESDEGNNAAQMPVGDLNLVARSLGAAYWSGEQVGLDAAIENAGYATLANVAFEIRRDVESGPVVYSGSIPQILPHETVHTVIPWDVALTNPATYNLFLVVDPFGTVTEYEESDNIVVGPVAVLPDLQADQWSTVCTNGVAEVVVRNIGAKPMGAGVARATQGAQAFGEAVVPALNPGQSADVAITLTQAVPAGWLTITANPDSTGEDEVTLLNNSATALIQATGDADGDGDVDLQDYVAFEGCLRGPLVVGAGDVDADGDVDLADFAAWSACLMGPTIAVGQACDAARLDADPDVDLGDFATFQGLFTGALAPTVECLHTFDFDADGDVDASDFATFAGLFGGP